MRPALRMLAAVKPAAASANRRYIQPGLPTGLTGLRSSPSPRSSLLYLYNATLEMLKSGAPESSLYRQSVENLTRHRLAVVESVVPEGWDEWKAKTKEIMKKYKDDIAPDGKMKVFSIDGARASLFRVGDQIFMARQSQPPTLIEAVEWDGEKDEGGELEGSRTLEERKEQILLGERTDKIIGNITEWAPEPQLTAEQIAEIEDKIGSGLIEELIQVAEGELKLTDIMIKSKAWESLEEKPAEDQWTYFDRSE